MPPPRPTQRGQREKPLAAHLCRRAGVRAAVNPQVPGSGRLPASAVGVLAARAGAVAGTAAWRLEPATTGACAPACAGRGRRQSTSGLPWGSRLLRSAQPVSNNGSRFLGPCPQLAEADMRAFGRDSGFDPKRR
jgi:hypothetical protein